jgi:hypothetical protein
MEYTHIGWCKDETTNSDKVWGIICLQEQEYSYQTGRWVSGGQYVTFWGRRGAKLQTKQWVGTKWDASEMFRKKTNKGYKSIDISELNEVYPEFQEDLEKTAMWSILAA